MRLDLARIKNKRIIIGLFALFVILTVLVVILYYVGLKSGNGGEGGQPGGAKQEVLIQEGEKTRALFSFPATFPALSSDGESVYYQNIEDGFFYKVSTSLGSNEKISRELKMVLDVVWSPDRTKAILGVKQDSHFFELYNSPFKNPEINDGAYSYWFYDFEEDFLKRIGGEEISNIVWSPDNKNILYNYTNIDGDNTSIFLAITNPYEKDWKVVGDEMGYGYSFTFLDTNNLASFWTPMVDDVECSVPQKINIETGSMVPLISTDHCFERFDTYPGSKWAKYYRNGLGGFINIDSKEIFEFSFGKEESSIDNAFSGDGRYFYSLAEEGLDRIERVNFSQKKVDKTINIPLSLVRARNIIIAPDERTIYFVADKDGLGYLYSANLE